MWLVKLSVGALVKLAPASTPLRVFFVDRLKPRPSCFMAVLRVAVMA